MRPGSDVEHIGALIRAKAYHMPAAMMYVSLVHLLDQQKRKELMIIYGEDIAATGLTASDLQGDKGHDRWPTIEKGLVERAQQKITLQEFRHQGVDRKPLVGRQSFSSIGWTVEPIRQITFRLLANLTR